jgi:hypothetical protein
MINYIVYSNSSYLDVLKIQTDHVKDKKNVTLFIDENDKNLEKIYENYVNVIFYKEEMTYAERLLTCLNQYENDYFILIHDIDILISTEDNVLENILSYMIKNNIDRVDLRHSDLYPSSSIIDVSYNEIDNWIEVSKNAIGSGLYMVKQDDPNNFIYNVNPSFWLKSTLIDIMSTFKDKTYRTIEGVDVQWYVTKFKIYRMYSLDFKKCGFYNSNKFFIFLHISHNGQFLPINESRTTPYGQSYEDVSSIYLDIIKKYDLINSDKWIK